MCVYHMCVCVCYAHVCVCYMCVCVYAHVCVCCVCLCDARARARMYVCVWCVCVCLLMRTASWLSLRRLWRTWSFCLTVSIATRTGCALSFLRHTHSLAQAHTRSPRTHATHARSHALPHTALTHTHNTHTTHTHSTGTRTRTSTRSLALTHVSHAS